MVVPCKSPRQKERRPSWRCRSRLLHVGQTRSARALDHIEGDWGCLRPLPLIRHALAYVFGRDAMFWYRAWLAFGRPSLLGTTVKDPQNMPTELVADEKVAWVAGQEVDVPATVGAGRTPGRGAAGVVMQSAVSISSPSVPFSLPPIFAPPVRLGGRCTTKNWIARGRCVTSMARYASRSPAAFAPCCHRWVESAPSRAAHSA